jgi:hypothetical protein
LVQVQTPDQQHMEWWGIPVLHCQSVPSFVCFGIGNFVVAFCFAVCCSVHSNIKLLCNKHLNFSNIQTTDFCATDSLNFSLFKPQTFVQQTVWTSVYSNIKLFVQQRLNFSTFKQQTFVQQTSDFSCGLLEVFKIPKDLQSFGTAKVSNLCDIHRTEYFINFRTLGYLEIDCSSMSEAIAVQRWEQKPSLCSSIDVDSSSIIASN